ncbi:MAG: phenylalanyl-tRNA synthetase subunit beta [Sulfurovum sp. FS08-3]|nr:MAG: phenylalanyl-tRNA synthetase subunit beta [Sulfurovum sp. FS08-3]
MIITRSWLSEFVDLDRISDEDIYKTLNAIGLEVDSMQRYLVPKGVVVGEIQSCSKHPNADKLNVCIIDIGAKQPVQIVCGAANVVDAKFVAVATIGTKMGDDFEIKPAVLREVESFGMVCSASELGLPKLNDGILILDDSIGKLVAGKPLNDYTAISDTIIELELTANRGDALSIRGVARDLSVALKRKLMGFDFKPHAIEKDLHINDVATVDMKDFLHADLSYTLATCKDVHNNLLIQIRLAFAGIEPRGKLDSLLQYTTHSTGVLLRGYKAEVFKDAKDTVAIELSSRHKGIVEVLGNDRVVSTLGVYQATDTIADDETTKVVIEASYIHPKLLVDAVSGSDRLTDNLYYNASRGSEPELELGIKYIIKLLEDNTSVRFVNGTLDICSNQKPITLEISNREICDIIGMEIPKKESMRILKALEFIIDERKGDIFMCTVPFFKQEVTNIYDITEEIVRIVGIDNIPSKPLSFTEVAYLNDATTQYQARKIIRNRCVGATFSEVLTYAFSDATKLAQYGFVTIKEELRLLNPIIDTLDTLRTTMMINLLEIVQKNINYNKKSLALFEIGAIFDENRKEKEVISFIFSGAVSRESIINIAKPTPIDFASFVDKLANAIGKFELVPTTTQNGLIHPYQSADIIIEGKVAGYLSRLHPSVQEDFDLYDTFIAQIDFDAIMPKHINARKISNYQGTYKDLSVVVDEKISLKPLMDSIAQLNILLLQDYYVIDIYQDEALGSNKSVTLRFFIQSMEKTLQDSEIETLMQQILAKLHEKHGALLR